MVVGSMYPASRIVIKIFRPHALCAYLLNHVDSGEGV